LLQSVATDIVWVNNYIVWQAIMWVPTLKETNQPKYILLVEAIAEAIEKGELKVGAFAAAETVGLEVKPESEYDHAGL
jgi:hypothetical protein